MGVFSGDKSSISSGAVDSVIGEKAKLKGELTTSGAVSVNGEFEGKLSSGGEVIISRGAKIVGDIEAINAVVSGKVDGNISATQSLEITKNGRVNGNLSGGKIIIEEGASYNGKVSVNSPTEDTEEEVEEEILISQDIPA